MSSISENRGPELAAVLGTVLGLAWIFTLLRAYVRFLIIKCVSSDDWWMFASLLGYTAYSINALWGIVDGGTGRHVETLTLDQVYIGMKAWYISEVLYCPVSAMVRTSVALFLLRIATEPLHVRIIQVNLAVIWLTSIAFTFVLTFQCDPPSHFYDQILGLEGKCMDIAVVPIVTTAHSVIGATCDLIYAFLPIAMLWNVQLNKRTKMVVALMLSMGFVAGIALLVRIKYIRLYGFSPDFLFETIDIAIWSVMEPSLGIIAGCLATLRPLFKDLGFGRSLLGRGSEAPSSNGRSSWKGSGGRGWNPRSTAGMQKLSDHGPAKPSSTFGAATKRSVSKPLPAVPWPVQSSDFEMQQPLAKGTTVLTTITSGDRRDYFAAK